MMRTLLTRACLPMAWLCLAVPLPSHALTYLVGAGTCDFNNLQAAINAAASSPGEDFIRVASDQSYLQQAITIGQQDLTIIGGYASCAAALPSDAVPAGSTILNGAGGAAAPVISITGSGVRVLSNLLIRNGDNVQSGTSCGGGVRFVGRGELRLRTVGVSQNSANNGGGVCLIGTGTPTTLSIEEDVTINNNEATTGSGGGIAISGTARLLMLRDRTLVTGNLASNGDGGGLYVQAPALAHIGSPGFNGTGVLHANEARRGGGLAIYAPEDSGSGTSCLRMFTTDAAHPVRIQDNRASHVGGGLYLRSDSDGLINDFAIWATLYDARIDGNKAPNGPAMFLDGDENIFNDDEGSDVLINRPLWFIDGECSQRLEDMGRVACTNHAECNRIDGNHAQDLAGQPTNGNVIELQDSSTINARLITMSGNTGTRLISWSESDHGSIHLEHCALTANTLTQELMRGFNDGSLGLTDCTIAGNAIGNTHVLRQDDSASTSTLRHVLIDQPGKLSLAHGGLSDPFNEHSWVLATDIGTLKPGPTVLTLQGSGRFMDPEHGDFRLHIGSQAVDYAPAPVPPLGDDVDLDGRGRNRDLQDVTANTRARDLGGYERLGSDPWLRNGDFVGDLRLWSNPSPTHATWAATPNAPGSGGGSLQFLVPSDQVGPTERRIALTQCFHVPSAGEYRITGKAMVASAMGNRDYPLVSWVLRYNNEACLGSAAASGEGFFSQSGAAFMPTVAPVTVPVDPAQWTWNTTIEVRLEVAQNQTSTTATSLFARFDDIEIDKFTDALFADGFEALTAVAP